MPKPARGFLYTELSADALTAGRLFDGLAVGSFRDMYNQAVAFKPDELPIYLSNTLAAIAATKSESGDVVGLPIDARDHDKGDGAGWIVGAELEGERIRLLPNWTEIGRELIGKSIRRFFSATVDTVNKVILGGTLTNWPATRDPKGKILLRPVELAEGLFELTDESMNDSLRAVYEAWEEQYRPPEPMPYCHIVDVFDDHVVVRMDDELYSATYTWADDGAITFAPQTGWVKVKQTYVEAALREIRRVVSKLLGNADKPAAKPAPINEGADEMPIKLSELSAEDRAELVKLVAAQVTPQPPAQTAPPPPVDLSQFLGMAALTDEAKKQLTDWMATQAKTVQEQAELAFKAQMLRIQRENQVTELAQRLTGGTAEHPRGLKNVTADDLKTHLLALPADEAKFFSDLLDGVVKDGLLEFAELGHGRRLTGVTDLPAEVSSKLDSGEFKLADLSNPILGLGDLAQYNLSKWQGK